MKIKLTIQQMHELAASKGGKYLSDVYVNIYTKLLWQCAEGHQWKASPYHIKNNNGWCPECAIAEGREKSFRGGKTKLTIEQM
mgnify:CR=1 FL=1